LAGDERRVSPDGARGVCRAGAPGTAAVRAGPEVAEARVVVASRRHPRARVEGRLRGSTRTIDRHARRQGEKPCRRSGGVSRGLVKRVRRVPKPLALWPEAPRHPSDTYLPAAAKGRWKLILAQPVLRVVVGTYSMSCLL